MANSKQSDKVGSKKKETGSVTFFDQSVLYLPGCHQLQTSSTPGPATGSDSRRTAVSKTASPAAVKNNDRHQFPKPVGVIYIKERYFSMLKKDLILRNPLRVMGYENDDILDTGQFGAVLARAGVGKTAFLVQLSLNALLRGKNVLHISLEDPVNKVSLWYKEVFNLIADQYQVDQISQLWDSLLPHRFIMTFRVEGFSVPKLEERLADLMEQNIFKPQMIIIDGFPFDESVHQPLSEFKDLVEKHQMHAWFTMRTHRHQDPGPDGRPLQLEQVSDLFEVAIQLLPEGKEIHVKAVKGGESFAEDLNLRLDPSTMLLKPQ
ncbi:MAG: cytoplasmic protein [Desulfobacteraceae bacterium]|nr:cytoplasmic protein [Desulfobacteraceae bacterium]